MKAWMQNSERVKGLLTVALITLSVYLGFRYLLPLMFPFIVAYFIAWIVRPVTEFLYRKMKLPRIIGGSISLLLLFGILCTAICFLLNILLKQAIAFVRNIPIYMNVITDRLYDICKGCDEFMSLPHGTVITIVEDNMLQTMNKVKSNIMPGLTEQTISLTVKMIAFIGLVLIVFVAALLIVKDLPGFRSRYEKYPIYRDIHKVTIKLTEAGLAYLRTQLIIMLIVAVLGVLGLTIIKNDYALLLGIGIGIMDALPILGSALVYIPWGIIMLMNGNIFAAAVLITTYLISQIIREILEPKLIGNRIGIKPIFTLISMYVGVKLFSIAGFFLGPIGLLMIMTIWKVLNEKAEEKDTSSDMSYSGD